jgi:WD40 repeat protein
MDLDSGRTLLELPDTAIYAAAFGPPGDDGLPRSVVVEDRDSGKLTLFDLATGKALGSYVSTAGWPASLALSPDGGRLALLMDTGRLVVLDVARIADGDDTTDPTRFDILAHAAGSKAVAFSNSDMIATGSSLDGVRVWSRAGELVASVPTHQEDTPTFAFAPGTDTLYYEYGDGVIRRFTIDADVVARLARSVLTRGFTTQECARYFPTEPCPVLGA